MKKSAILPAALVAILIVAAFLSGRRLAGPDSSEPAYDLKAVSYEAARPVLASSRGGFSGLEEGAGVAGDVLLSGSILSAGQDRAIISTESGPVTVTIAGNRSLREIAPG